MFVIEGIYRFDVGTEHSYFNKCGSDILTSAK